VNVETTQTGLAILHGILLKWRGQRLQEEPTPLLVLLNDLYEARLQKYHFTPEEAVLDEKRWKHTPSFWVMPEFFSLVK